MLCDFILDACRQSLGHRNQHAPSCSIVTTVTDQQPQAKSFN